MIAPVFQHFHTLFRTVSSPAHFFSSSWARSLHPKAETTTHIWANALLAGAEKQEIVGKQENVWHFCATLLSNI